MQNHSVSVSGGSQKIKYYASVDYLSQDGVIINSDFTRYSSRFNLDVTEGIFKFGLSLNPSVTIENAVNSDGAIIRMVVVSLLQLCIVLLYFLFTMLMALFVLHRMLGVRIPRRH